MKVVKIIGVLIVFIAVSIFGAHTYVTSKVEAVISEYIEKSKTYAGIQYRSLDFSILNREILLNDVTVLLFDQNPKKPISIESIQISNFDINETIPSNLGVKAKGLKMDRNSDFFNFLEGLGYDDDINSTISFWFQYDEATGTIGYKDFSIILDDIGTISMSVRFGNCFLDEAKIEEYSKLKGDGRNQDDNLVERGEVFDFFKDGTSYRDITFKSYSLTYKDNSFADRFFKKSAQESSVSIDAYKSQIIMMVKIFASMQFKDLSNKDRIECIENFINDTDQLRLSIIAKDTFRVFDIIDPDADNMIGGNYAKEESIQEKILNMVNFTIEN